MRLIWGDDVYHVTSASRAERGKEIGLVTDEYSTWQIFELKGHSRDYIYAAESGGAWRVMSRHEPEKPFAQYILEIPDGGNRLTNMLSVTLYNDGRALLAISPVSSFMLRFPYYYTFTDDELLIHYEDGDVFARFGIEDENTIVFKSATVPLYTEEGAKYIIK
jgi:hypothetical protein